MRLAAQVLLVVLFAVPSTIIEVGLIGLWNRPGPLGVLYGTDAMLLLAYLARFVPVATLILAAATQTVSVSQEEASAVSGVGWLRTVRGIVLPQLRVGVGGAWVVAFVLAFGELVPASSWRRRVRRHCRFASTRSSPTRRLPTWPCSRYCNRP